MTSLTIAEPALPNEHRWTTDVHYRLYLGPDDKPCVITVQDFDYVDYDDTKLLTEDAYDDEFAAKAALNSLMMARLNAPDFTPDVAAKLIRAGIPVTRQQALDAALA